MTPWQRARWAAVVATPVAVANWVADHVVVQSMPVSHAALQVLLSLLLIAKGAFIFYITINYVTGWTAWRYRLERDELRKNVQEQLELNLVPWAANQPCRCGHSGFQVEWRERAWRRLVPSFSRLKMPQVWLVCPGCGHEIEGKYA